MNNFTLPVDYADIESLEARLKEESEEEWIKRGEENALSLFYAMAERVPAYKDFLKAHKIAAKDIKTIDDFSHIPPVDKDNYLRKYPRNMLCWDGDFANNHWVISTTSGSTGQPYYFPHYQLQDLQYAVTAELYLRSNFSIQDKSTLYIVAFPMGAWIGGLFTYEALKVVAYHGGYNLSIITPGIHKQEVISAIKQLGNDFDQIIIGAYAPFLKDILDDGTREGIDWDKLNVGFVFSAEAFNEKFRDYVLHAIGSSGDMRATLNHYGTVDMGTMAHETPESILTRRILNDSEKLDIIFPEGVRQPTFAQYNPELFYFEEVNKNLLCTANSGIPLVRYNLKDYGGVIRRSEVHQTLLNQGIDLRGSIKKAEIQDTLWNLPYVYVYERDDFSVSYYAFLIYPDTVRRALQIEELLQFLTGKFSMMVDYDTEGRQKLHIHVEAKHGIKKSPELLMKIKQTVHHVLTEESSEYRETSRMVGEDAKPVIHIWKYEDPTYFKSGTKQKWVVK